jgi:hypothetical protein
MENQHKLIKGYRELSAEEIALMNEVKEAGVALHALVDKVGLYLGKQCSSTAWDSDEAVRQDAANPFHWHASAVTDLQVGIMKLVRSIAQPTTF